MRTETQRDDRDFRPALAAPIPSWTTRQWVILALGGRRVPAVVAMVGLTYADGIARDKDGTTFPVDAAYLDGAYEKQLLRTNTHIEDELAQRAQDEGLVFRRNHTKEKS